MGTQIVKTKCCGHVFAACAEPYCYTDKDWLKNLKKYVNGGDIVEMLPAGKHPELESCECKKPQQPKKNSLTLF